MKTENPIKGTGIKSVRFYIASPVECCDRCSQGIKYVALVAYADGTVAKYGMDCINRVLSSDNSLKRLFKRNSDLLKRYEENLRILNLPEDEMPIDERGYYNRGIFFVAGLDGRAIFGKNLFFHPTKLDWDRFSNASGCSKTLDMRECGKGCWEEMTPENWAIKCRHSIGRGRIFFKSEIDRLSTFCARVLTKAASNQFIVANGKTMITEKGKFHSALNGEKIS